MLSLAERIKAEAVEKLALPPGRRPTEELPRYKRFLKRESHRLKILHRGGAGGREVCRARALVLDLLLGSIFDTVCQQFVDVPRQPRPKLALVAVGGYGRGELNPCSDIDILILHSGDSVMTNRGKPHPLLAALTGPDGFLYSLFDMGLKVGHSTRNIEDCVRAADSDMLSKTAFLEARLVTGDAGLFKQMQSVLLARCVRGKEYQYIQARLTDQTTRRAKYGNSACMQEPNLKNGCGGLRDFQNLFWMAFVKYRAQTPEALRERKVMDDADKRQLEAAYDFLLRVRNELHYHANRTADNLTRAIQPAIATNLGFTDRSTVRRIEKFMRQLYLHMRNIYLITRTVEQRLALLPLPEQRLPTLKQLWRSGRSRFGQQLIDGFKVVDHELCPVTPRVFADEPKRLMRVFLYAQQRGLTLHPDLAQMIRHKLALVDRKFLLDDHVRQTFMEILNQRGNVGPILRTMHEAGFLGKYVPEFGKLTALVQHEFFHQYTADEHTLMCLEKLDDIWSGKSALYKPYAEVFRELERPSLLYLAVLLHDAGKGYDSPDHSEKGAALALRIAHRLGLDGGAAHTLRLVVEQHLLMAQVSQRRDLDDPAEVRAFTSQIQNVETLLMLTLLTLADSLATSDKLWNGFKDTLLWTLHHKARTHLAGGTDFVIAESRQREMLRDEVRQKLPDEIHPGELAAHFHSLPPRYFLIHSAAEILADLSMVHEFMKLQVSDDGIGLAPVVVWENAADRGFTRCKVCTWDRFRLFGKITGALTAAGLNILAAQIFSRRDGVILDTFFVVDARTGALPSPESSKQAEQILNRMLTESFDPAALIAKQTKSQPLFSRFEGAAIPTRIQFDTFTSKDRTVVDIETEDRVGLLYAISHVFADCNLDISVAKIFTEKGAACDTFYVHINEGGKLEDEKLLLELEAKLQDAVASLGMPAKRIGESETSATPLGAAARK